MYKTLKTHLKHHKPLSKLVAFKLVVLLGFVQNILFSILLSTGALKPSETLTFADVRVGIPVMCTCIEMVPISLFFHYAYSYRPYCLDGKHRPIPVSESAVAPPTPISSYQGGLLGYRALLLALNPREVFEAFLFAFKMATVLRSSGSKDHGSSYSEDMVPLQESTVYTPGPYQGQVGDGLSPRAPNAHLNNYPPH